MSTNKSALAKNTPTPLAEWKNDLFREGNLSNFAKVLAGTGLSPERFAWQGYALTQRTPALLEAPRIQLWTGVFAAAECGLSLQPMLQQYHLVTFAKQIQPLVGYQGLTYLAAKAGDGLMEAPIIVWQRDVEEHRFRYREGTKRIAELDPVPKNPNAPRGELRYVIATYVRPSGLRTFKVMERAELLERRERSSGWQAFKSGRRKTSPWAIQHAQDGSEAGDWLAMCLKTVVRDFAKYLPKSADHWGERAAKAETVEGVMESTEAPVDEALAGVLDTTLDMQTERTATEQLKRDMGLTPEDADFTEVKKEKRP